jgi:hypothetical protein
MTDRTMASSGTPTRPLACTWRASVDALFIRSLLVAALMHIIGPQNWWLPGWRDRRLPTVASETEGDAPTDPIEPGSTRDLVGIGVGPPQQRANV